MDLELHVFIGKRTLSRAVLLTGRHWVPTTHPVHLKKPGNPAFTVNNQCSLALFYTTDQDRDSYFTIFIKLLVSQRLLRTSLKLN